MAVLKGLSRIQMQIMWDRLRALVEEQAAAMMRTAFSLLVRESGDLSSGVFDPKGRMLAQAVTGTPGHVNTMAASVKHFIQHFPVEAMRQGDIYITNDPWMGTGHLHDFILVTPVFHRGRLAGLTACTSHQTDIGGLGFVAYATDVHMEGLYIPFLKLADEGVFNDTLMKIIRANSRLPAETEGDVYALAGSNDIGAHRLSEMMEEFELNTLNELSDHIIRNSRNAVIAEIAKLPKGVYRNTKRIDAYEKQVDLVATLTISKDGIHVDYEGTSLCSRYGVNVPLSYAAAYTCFGLACVVAPWVPNNTGSLEPYRVTAPPGSILNPQYPAAVAARANIGLILPDVVFGCLVQAVPERVPAESTSSLWSLNAHGPRSGDDGGPATYTTSCVLNGGAGARPTKDGLSATAFPSGVRSSPVEIVEAEVPVTIWRKEYRPDSGGAGQYRGGHGLIIEVETNDGAPFELRGTFEHRANPPRGRCGGLSGAPGYVGLASGIALKGKGRDDIAAGERVIMMTPGGGGFGPPGERERSAVVADVRDGLVTLEAAQRDYGVEILDQERR